MSLQLTPFIMMDGNAKEAIQFYEKLQQDGQVNMPLQETYFSPAYGLLTDKFGIAFQIFTKRSR